MSFAKVLYLFLDENDHWLKSGASFPDSVFERKVVRKLLETVSIKFQAKSFVPIQLFTFR